MRDCCDTMPNSMAGRRIAQQLLDAGTSVAANYRAVCRAYTSPLFISKLAIVDEEADESEFWCRIIRQTGIKGTVVVHELVVCARQQQDRASRLIPQRFSVFV
jgi:four helix bundle protein